MHSRSWTKLWIGIGSMILLLLGQVRAQDFSLQSYSVAEGLAQSQVYAMQEDSRGNLWLGTWGGGISIFDGVKFRNLSVQEGLVNDYVYAIAEDANGNMWVGTDGGASSYDGTQFTQYTTENGLQSNRVNTILHDSEGRVWFGTGNGLDIFDPGTKEPTWYHWNKKEGLTHPEIFALTEDEQHNIWIGTDGGIFILRANNQQNLNHPELLRLTTEEGLSNYLIRSIFEDHNNKIWIGTFGGGICYFDPAKSSLQDEKPIQSLEAEGLPDAHIYSILEDSSGNLWFGTWQGGAARFDGNFFTYFSEEDGLLSNAVRSLLEDSWGNVWMGTSGGGVSKFSGDPFLHFTQKNGIPGNRVYAVVEDDDGNLWFSTSARGVTRFDGTNFQTFRKEEGFVDEVVKAMHKDASGNLWFGTEGEGLARYDGDTFRIWSKAEGLGIPWVKSILEDQYGHLWLATAGGGVFKFANGKFEAFRTWEGLSDNRTLDLLEDQEGGIWVATNNGGVNRFDGKKFQQFGEADGLCDDYVRSLAMDSHGDIWLGTAEGLSRAKKQKNGNWQFTCFGRADGLTSNNIYLTHFDDQGNLWVGNERGVDKISFNAIGNLKEISAFGKSEGFVGIETCQRAAYTDDEGNLWFGTINGLTMHTPRENTRNRIPPKTHITGVRLFYKNIGETEYAEELSPWYGIPTELDLPHRQNHLGFEFIGINHKNPKKVTYSWRLDPYEAEWTPTTGNNEATYSNLEPGEYTFFLKACNEDGICNEEPVAFSFSIRPPFWSRWWFRIAAIAIFLGLIALIFQIRIRQIRKENEARSRKVELERNLLELEQKALRLQMNPHFIFNALNSIKGTMAQNDTASARRYLVKFARLMRLILDNSRAAYIPIDHEIQTLELYLEIEKLSKSDSFGFKVEVDDEVDRESMGIPPMLVQPFVENAILHGVAPLESGGMIVVRFSREGNQLRCEVEDNGVGREKAMELKASLGKAHRSTAIEVTKERLGMMQGEAEAGFSVEIIDLYDEMKKPAGTRVELRMPFVEL